MNPIIAIDVSKEKSVASVFTDRHTCFLEPFVFKHKLLDLERLNSKLMDLSLQFGAKPKVVMEATGVYSKPLASFFFALGYDVYVLNPLTTSHIKSKSMRKAKTDPIDTKRIATAFYNQRLIPYAPSDDIYEKLRFLQRQYDGLNTTYQELVIRMHTVIDLIYPNFNKMFYTVRGKGSLHFLKAFPIPQMVLDASLEELAVSFHASNKGKEWHLKKAALIKEVVRESPQVHAAQQTVLVYYVDLILHMQDTLTDIRAQMHELARLSPHYELLCSVPGIGEVTAAVILSEIGDISRFHSKKQLIAYAGLDPSVFQSGKFTAKNSKISKRGSPYLRKALYQAAFAGISKRSNGYANKELRTFYDRLIRNGKTSRLALTATSAKLLRMIFGMLISSSTFRYE